MWGSIKIKNTKMPDSEGRFTSGDDFLSIFKSKETKKIAPTPKRKFRELSDETLVFHNEGFSKNFAKLGRAAKAFREIDMEEVKYVTLKTYTKEISPVVRRFLTSMNGCKRAYKGMAKGFRGMVDLLEKHPELLKDEEVVNELNEIKIRMKGAFAEIEKYEKMVSDVEEVTEAWPETNYSVGNSVYQTAQKPIGAVWEKFVEDKSVLNKVASRARHYMEEAVCSTLVEDEHNVTAKVTDVADKVVDKTKDVVVKIVDKADDEFEKFIEVDDE
jgi:hypothetical protein